jgi:hypothetical protein
MLTVLSFSFSDSRLTAYFPCTYNALLTDLNAARLTTVKMAVPPLSIWGRKRTTEDHPQCLQLRSACSISPEATGE